MDYTNKLLEWLLDKSREGARVSINLFPGSNPSVEDRCQEAYEVLTGSRVAVDETDVPC